MIVIDALNEAVQWLAFSPCSQFVVASGQPKDDLWGTMQFWSTSGEWVKCFPENGYVAEFALNSDGRWAFGKRFSNEVTALDMQTGKEYKLGEDPSVANVHCSADGKKLLARIQVKDEHYLTCWRQPPASRPVKLWSKLCKGRSGYPYRMGFFPDGERIFCVESKMNRPLQHTRIAVRSAKTGDYIQYHDGTIGSETAIVTPDGQQLLTRYGATIYAYSTADLALAPRLITKGVTSCSDQFFSGVTMAHHPTLRQLAITNRDKTVTYFDTETGETSKMYKWPVPKLRSIAFSPDGTLAAAGSENGKIVVWDVDL